MKSETLFQILKGGSVKPLCKKSAKKISRALQKMQEQADAKIRKCGVGLRPLCCPCHKRPVIRTGGGLISYVCPVTKRSVDPFGPRYR